MKLLVFFLSQLAFVLCVENRTLSQYIHDHSQFSILDELLNHAHLSATLNSPGTFTIFAPTNDAFNKLPAGLLDNLKGVDTVALVNLLKYHVTAGILIAPLLSNGMTVTSLDNRTIHVNKYPNGAVVLEGSTVTGGDIIVTNGVLHAVSSVMFPAVLSIAQYMGKDESEYIDLYSALIFTDLEQALDSKGTFTVFAPNNQAFNQALGTLQTVASDKNTFADILKYHVVPQTLFSAGLTDGQTLTTLQGTDLVVHIDSTGVHINNALVLKADQPMTNGVIHMINTILTPL
ncbi:transforming growth factor-beta-induced protein ig-h3-like [Mizuhopecten yessoensis]|uniref:Transforming growth factor-beta-induced protein ig-h3 n=1 Tax=Mizuhopecten yessoensis TaxID=6573 RepID=A0A210QAF9_MIZYE|nr:transforming growth factor-beta-induced protein ig-h3-like [Mizuhopecten yessoensis]OWF45717.1 Transforming growth factor-beta-induced protein ig-h3 [Mizuhopecten yessoensis]